MGFYTLVINKNEKQPQKLVKETNSKLSNMIEATVDEDSKIHKRTRVEGKNRLVYLHISLQVQHLMLLTELFCLHEN